MKSDFKQPRHYVFRALVATVSAYLVLFAAEATLWRLEPRTYLELYHGIYEAKEGRVVLKPGYEGRFELGGRSVETRVNSHGHRGREPEPNPGRRILMVGDSFAFGALLDDSETIAARMEVMEPGLEVANLGVIGYNLPQQLMALRDCTLPARQVVYLFFYNDFEPPLPEVTMVNGRVVTKRRPDGTASSDQEMRAASEWQARKEREPHPFVWSSVAHLSRLNVAARNAIHRLSGPQAPVDWWPLEKDQTHMVSRSVRHTLDIRDLAAQRQMAFLTAIAPGLAEVKEGRHSRK